jgi:hypothetical protein
MLCSKVKLLLGGDSSQQSLLDFIEESMKTPAYKAYIEVLMADL